MAADLISKPPDTSPDRLKALPEEDSGEMLCEGTKVEGDVEGVKSTGGEKVAADTGAEGGEGSNDTGGGSNDTGGGSKDAGGGSKDTGEEDRGQKTAGGSKNPLEYLLEAVEQSANDRPNDGDSDHEGPAYRSAYPSPPRPFPGGPRRAPVSAFSRSPSKRSEGSGGRGDGTPSRDNDIRRMAGRDAREGRGDGDVSNGLSPSRRTSMMIATDMADDSGTEDSGHEHDYRHSSYPYGPRGGPAWEGGGPPSWQSQYGGPYGPPPHWGPPSDYHNGMMMGGGMPPPGMPPHHPPHPWGMGGGPYRSDEQELIERARDEERLARWHSAGATEQEIQRWQQYHRTAPGRPRYGDEDPALYRGYMPLDPYYYRPHYPATMKPVQAKKQKTHAELKPSRVRPYAYVGMMKEKGDPVELWRNAVAETWKEAYPDEEMPEKLNIDDAGDRGKIVQLVKGLCATKGINCFRAEALDHLLTRYHLRLFPTRNFLDVNITLSSAKLLSVESGLLSILARAIGVEDYRLITNKDNVLKWYNMFTKCGFS